MLYCFNSQQISNIAENSYRTEGSGANTPETKESQFSYDANGNLLGIYTGTKQGDKLKVTNTRKLLWDEENRLLAVSDNGFVSSYYYDAAGERTVKMSGDAEGVFVNGVLSGGRTGTANFTAYINPYMAVNNGGIYTKHIYMGSQRITSKVSNSGIFGTSPENTTDLKPKYTAQTAALKLRYDSLGVQYKGVEKSGSIVSSSPSGVSASYFYHPDHLGSSSLITDVSGDIVQHVEYVPFGGTFIDERRSQTSWHTPFLFSGKECDEETGLLYVSQRYQDEKYGIWYSVDPLAEKYPWCSPYVYCNNNPIKYIDPTGLAWRPTSNQNTGEQTGYEWVPEDQSYDKNGSLKTGLYAQAIFFSENGTYDSNSDYNMGSSTAYVYLADGTTTTFDASTHPSDQDNYATVPGGLYEAKVGQHKGSYTALRMGDVGTTNFDNNRIELGTENPAFDDGRTYATGINIHKPGIGNKTGMTTSGSPISAGCSLIDRDSWGDFIGIFNTSEQRNNVVSVTMSRTMAQPTNTNILLRVPTGPIPSELLQRPDATRVAIPYRR